MSNTDRLIAIVALQVTLAVSAAEVNSVMTNTRHKFYMKSGDIAKVHFEITAKRFIEDYSQRKKKTYFLFTKLSSNKVTQFHQGTLYFNNSKLNFKQAFWSQGQLVLTEASGFIEQQKFYSPEIAFSKQAMQLSAKNITFRSDDKISRKLSFKHTVAALY